ncbi:unnamed protein product [Caenorhabditis bovis]|uniref:Major facilitator superfamily (MFS) profile domain-containing protein n=1 Tax=Caenorhabditis bovis TaxID=2654633 RepID=A0A8S1EMI4_9PELO|nr:unnamed protein product [Caenorhabditis bovis]
MGSEAKNEQQANENEAATFKVYKERWLVLAVCCFLALSNAMVNFTQTQNFYRGTQPGNGGFGYDVSLITNQIFQFVAVFTGFGGMYITDNLGIRVACLLGTTLNVVGATLRLVASNPLIESYLVKELILHSGSFICASAQAFFLVLPSKIAECWFPCDQRAIANVLSFVANPAGVALGTIIPSLIFPPNKLISSSWTFFQFTLGMELLALFPFILALFIKHKIPPTPPSLSSAAHQTARGFGASIISCITNVQFVIQMFIFAFAFSLLWSLMIYLESILNIQGYNLQGYPTAVCAIVGTLSSLLAGHVADKTKRFKEIIRFCTVGFALCIICLRCYLMYPYGGVHSTIIVYTLCGLLGAFSIPQFPIGVELGVETTFPVLEATSSGILVISGSLWMFIIPFLHEAFDDLNWFYNTGENEKNWQLALDLSCFIACVSVILSIFFMRPRYRRLELEESKVSHQTLSPNSSRLTEESLETPRSLAFEMQ